MIHMFFPEPIFSVFNLLEAASDLSFHPLTKERHLFVVQCNLVIAHTMAIAT